MFAENYIRNWADVVEHVLARYPEEAGGIVDREGTFRAVENCSDEPLLAYEFPPSELAGVDVRCILHSHPYDPMRPLGHDPREPSKTDLQGQVDTDVEWAVVVTEGENVTQPFFFGDYDHRPPLMQREFIHNNQDCLGFMADWQYQNFGLRLPAEPRDADWIEHGGDLISELWEPWGFVDVTHLPEARGDVLLYRIQSDRVNHVGVVVEPNQMAHHFSRRLPQAQPTAVWSRYIVKRVRHRSNPAYTGD